MAGALRPCIKVQFPFQFDPVCFLHLKALFFTTAIVSDFILPFGMINISVSENKNDENKGMVGGFRP
jgi:hypothetical protein